MADDGIRVVARGGEDGRRRRGGPSVGVVLAVVAALVVGGLVGRLTAPDGPSPATPSPPSGGQAGVGPARVQAGVPVGYARSEEGAAAALLNYSVVLARLVLESPAERRGALRVLATPEFAQRTATQLDRARSAAEQGPLGAALRGEGTAVFRGGPLGFRVVNAARDEATVDTWAFGLVAATSGLEPRMIFQTSTSTLRWVDGDWKLAATRSRPGPAPAVDEDAQVSGRAFVDSVGRLRELRYAP